MTLPLRNLDDRTWLDLTEEGRGLIPRYAPTWTDFNAHDPGITFVELLAYRTEQELFRLNAIGDAYRQAFLTLFGPQFRPAGARPAVALLAYEPDPRRPAAFDRVSTGEWFAPWPPPPEADTQADDDRLRPGEQFRRPADPLALPVAPPVVRPLVYRAAHDLCLTGIRIAAVQSFDGRTYRDITEVLARTQEAPAWGTDPIRPEQIPADGQPALYLGLDLQLRGDRKDPGRDLTIWFVPGGPAQCPLVPPGPAGSLPHPGECGPPPAKGSQPYDPAAPPPRHHGLEVVWEYQAGCEWLQVPHCRPFRDETRGLTRAGRVVIPAGIFPPEQPEPGVQQGKAKGQRRTRVIGAVPAAAFYLRCRLACGLPDTPPVLRGVFADTVLVEQWDRAETQLTPLPRTPDSILHLPDLRLSRPDLQLEADVGADVEDAAADLANRGWGPEAAAWGRWPVSNRAWTRLHPWTEYRRGLPGRDLIPYVVLGIGTGEPDQRFRLLTPPRWPKPGPLDPPLPDEDLPAVVIADSLEVWTMEPPWAWEPGSRPGACWRERPWRATADFRLCSRLSAAYVFDPERNEIVFGNGETGVVPPPGSVVVAGFRWTAGELGNVGAGLSWGRLEDIQLPRPGRPAVPTAVRFRNPLPACGGKPAEELRAALGRLAAEFDATERLVALADYARASTLDGIDLGTIPPPPLAVTLLDFEALARSTPGATVARARAWAETDPATADLVVPGTVAVAIVPRLPADRPEPTPGLVRLVADYLSCRRPVTCRVCVVGPEYLRVGVKATVHATPGTGQQVGDAARKAVEAYLHPLSGGPAGTGWPFGRNLHPGEVLQVLAAADGVRYVTGLQLAANNGPWGERAVAVPARALVAAQVEIDVQEDA
jgi:hypothetical protein